MCKDCRCDHEHTQVGGEHHHHDHGLSHHHGETNSGAGKLDDAVAADVAHSAAKPISEVTPPVRRVISLEHAVLSANDHVAAENRQFLAENKIFAVNLISSPGAGKTALLEQTLELARRQNIPTAVLVGDQYGEADAARLRNRGAAVTQIEVHESCHLTAAQIQTELRRSVPSGTKLLIIENVGNLVCPVAFDLGEAMKIVLLSTPEGEDKPLKYPGAFVAADLVLLTKMDLCSVLDYNLAQALHNVKLVHPEVEIIELSSRRGDGMDKWMEFITNNVL
ncbi:MAG: hydrogenase nickel incorporation protein HypB [Lentisphaeria bacterium]|nr:hydrogenase nickel incorporation protein HypB [Lentisphaeria bacterium]